MQRFAKAGVHVAVAGGAFVAAYQLAYWHPRVWWTDAENLATVAQLTFVYAVLAALVETAFRVERSSWRYVSLGDALLLARSSSLTALFFLALTFVLARADGLPRSTFVLAWLFHLAGTVGVRVLWRARFDDSLLAALTSLRPRFRAGTEATPLLIIGPSGDAETFLRDLGRRAEPDYAPVAILSPDASDTGHHVRGVPVLATTAKLKETLKTLARRGDTPRAVLFLCELHEAPEITPEQIGRFKADGVKLLRLPAVTEVDSADEAPASVREISLEELLPRPPIAFDEAEVRAFVNGRRVLVTGAAGSIGSELCRQVAAMGCAHLTLVDISESGLFNIERELAARFPGLAMCEVLCDIRDASRLARWFEQETPEVVFHAAALKHVPMMEKYPCEGVLTNIAGTRNVIEAAEAARAEHFVLISTDKAVDPGNVMGATKRFAEALTRSRSRSSATTFSVVRFGNVLGSAGSVVPIFQGQLERGGPLTVTHEDVERFFMTIPEAVQLVLYATSMAAARPSDEGRLFVLEMGEPVKIMDLARQIIELSGKRPGVDVQIEVTGLRPGEKIKEELVDRDELAVACSENVMEVINNTDHQRFSDVWIQELERAARRGDSDLVRQHLFQAIERLRTSLSVAV